MGKRSRNQHKAKKDRADRRKRAGELGLERPIIARHRKGTDPEKKKKKKKQPVTIYQLVLSYVPSDQRGVDSLVSNIRAWCDKTEAQAEAIVARAKKGENPVLLSSTSKPDASMRRINFSQPIRYAIEIIEKKEVK